jgi:hypothetical protein
MLRCLTARQSANFLGFKYRTEAGEAPSRGFDRGKRLTAWSIRGQQAGRSAAQLLRSLDCLDLVAKRLLQRRQAMQ